MAKKTKTEEVKTTETSNVVLLTNEKSFMVRSGNKSVKLSKAIFDLLHGICKAVGKEIEYGHWDFQFYVYNEGSSEHNTHIKYEVPTAVVNAFWQFRKDLEPGLVDLYNKGRIQGTNLLFQLNNGEISTDDFNAALR